MCEHCDTILDVIRDAEMTTYFDPNGGIDGSPWLSLEFPYRDQERGLQRAKSLEAAMQGICGNRTLIEKVQRPIAPRPSQKKAKAR